MAATGRRYSRKDFARRGAALFESKVRPHLTEADQEKLAAIDIESGEYELDKNEFALLPKAKYEERRAKYEECNSLCDQEKNLSTICRPASLFALRSSLCVLCISFCSSPPPTIVS